MESSIVIFERASLMLAEADTIQKVKEFKTLALTAADLARRKGMGEKAVQYARSYALEAEGKMGEMVQKTERQKPVEYKKKSNGDKDEPFEKSPSLSELGLTKRESSEAQLLADIPKESIEEIKQGKKSRSAVLNEKRREKKRSELKGKQLEVKEKKYRIIYADPPWEYGQWLPHQYGDAKKEYPTMSIDEICAMPIREIAQDDSVLFLWITSPKLEQAFKVIRAWGFEYKTSFVWDKVKHNFGFYNSVRHEFLLIAGRGTSTPDSKELVDSVVEIERSDKHSQKPDYFRDLIDKLYTWGNRIELFLRGEPKDGWDGFGNE